MATFITSKAVGETINIYSETTTGFWKYNHDGSDSSVNVNGWTLNQPVANANGEFTIIPCDGAGNVSGDITQLNLGNNQLTSFDGTSLTSLTNLNLYNNQLTSLVGFIFPTSLTTLQLGNNQLTSFDATGLPNLVGLVLTSNPLTPSVNNQILNQLIQNGLSGGYFESNNGRSSASIADYNNLVSLGWEFSGLQIIDTTPPPTFITSKAVGETINIYVQTSTGFWKYNHDGSDSSVFNQEDGYQTITVSNVNGEFTIIPCDSDGTVNGNVTRLNLQSNQLTSFDGTGLSSLTNLRLYNNQLTSFDGTGLTGLIQLYLQDNQLTSFDGTGLSSLIRLNLDTNQLTSLSGFILPTSLEDLSLGGNQLTSFDGTGLSSLTNLSLNENLLTSFDGTGLSGLTYLYLDTNQLTSFDGTGLSSLTYLNLNNNQFTPSSNNQILNQLNQNGLSGGEFYSSNGRTSASNTDYDNLVSLGWYFEGLDLIAVGNGKLRVRGVISTPPFIPQEGSFTVNVTGSEYTYLGIGSSTGYIKVRYWNGVEEILGNGDMSTYVPDESNQPSSMIWVEKEFTDSIPNKTINYYPCLSDGTMSGDIVYLLTQESVAYQTVLPQTLKGLWLYSYNRSNTLDLTSLTSLETFIYRDSTTLTTIDLSNISTLKLVVVGNQTESVFPLQNVLISNPSNLDKFKVYRCGISQFDVTTVSNASKLWLEGTSLTSMDLSQSNATELDIRNSQLLTSLTLSTNVVNLVVSNAPLLSNLDLTGLSNIIYLGIENVPSLETLDTSDLVSLTILGLSGGWLLDGSARIPLNITSLDLSNNTLLTHLTYELSIPETLDLTNNNNLIYLNVANANNLTSILGLSDTNIIRFLCRNSQSLDLDLILNDINLEELTLSNIINTTLDLSQQTNLTQLNIDNSGFNALLPLESINLIGLNNLGSIGMDNLSSSILDDALIDLNGNTKTNGYFYNATGRSSASNSAVSGLVSKGWTVYSW